MNILTPRKISLDTTAIPRYWAGGMVYPTHFFNAISLSFPPVEKMVVVTMRAVLKDVENAALKGSIKDFCAQESSHSAIHHKFNKWLLNDAPAPAAFEAYSLWCKGVNTRPMKERVAIMIAFEYFTGSCSRLIMRTFADARASGKIDEESFKMWYWHCAEELEHHEMGWELIDLYGVSKSDLNSAVREFMSVYYPYLFSAAYELVVRDNKHKSPKVWVQASAFLCRHLRRISPYYFKFFDSGFGPDTYKELDDLLMHEFYESGIEYST